MWKKQNKKKKKKKTITVRGRRGNMDPWLAAEPGEKHGYLTICVCSVCVSSVKTSFVSILFLRRRKKKHGSCVS